MINAALERHEHRMVAHLDAKVAELQAVLKDGYPNGDVHAHRMAHEQFMRDAAGWDKLKSGAMSHLLNYGMLAALLWVAYTAWQAFKESIGR